MWLILKKNRRVASPWWSIWKKLPRKNFDVMTATSKNYLTHMIGVVKSYLPQFNLAPSCSDEKFREYCKESEVIAEEILKKMAE